MRFALFVYVCIDLLINVFISFLTNCSFFIYLLTCLFVVFVCIFSLQEQESRSSKKIDVDNISGPQGLLVYFFEFHFCLVVLLF